MVEQLDSEVAVDNGVQPKSRLDKVAVQDEAEGLKTPEERLQTPDRGGEGVQCILTLATTHGRRRGLSIEIQLAGHMGKKQTVQ